jgi:multiple sugar transport system permease protein
MTEHLALDSVAEVEAIAGRTTDIPEVLAWDSKLRRTVTIYIPLALFVIVLLFPFYWMAIRV